MMQSEPARQPLSAIRGLVHRVIAPLGAHDRFIWAVILAIGCGIGLVNAAYVTGRTGQFNDRNRIVLAVLATEALGEQTDPAIKDAQREPVELAERAKENHGRLFRLAAQHLREPPSPLPNVSCPPTSAAREKLLTFSHELLDSAASGDAATALVRYKGAQLREFLRPFNVDTTQTPPWAPKLPSLGPLSEFDRQAIVGAMDALDGRVDELGLRESSASWDSEAILVAVWNACDAGRRGTVLQIVVQPYCEDRFAREELRRFENSLGRGWTLTARLKSKLQERLNSGGTQDRKADEKLLSYIDHYERNMKLRTDIVSALVKGDWAEMNRLLNERLKNL